MRGMGWARQVQARPKHCRARQVARRKPAERPRGAHLPTSTNIRGSAKRNAAFTLQHGAMLTTRQPEGCVPVVVSRCGRAQMNAQNLLAALWQKCQLLFAL